MFQIFIRSLVFGVAGAVLGLSLYLAGIYFGVLDSRERYFDCVMIMFMVGILWGAIRNILNMKKKVFTKQSDENMIVLLAVLFLAMYLCVSYLNSSIGYFVLPFSVPTLLLVLVLRYKVFKESDILPYFELFVAIPTGGIIGYICAAPFFWTLYALFGFSIREGAVMPIPISIGCFFGLAYFLVSKKINKGERYDK